MEQGIDFDARHGECGLYRLHPQKQRSTLRPLGPPWLGTGPELAGIAVLGLISGMSAAEIIEQIEALPPNERAEVAKFVAETDDSWVPESFKRGMADAEAGRFVDMETVLSGAKPPPRRTE